MKEHQTSGRMSGIPSSTEAPSNDKASRREAPSVYNCILAQETPQRVGVGSDFRIAHDLGSSEIPGFPPGQIGETDPVAARREMDDRLNVLAFIDRVQLGED